MNLRQLSYSTLFVNVTIFVLAVISTVLQIIWTEFPNFEISIILQVESFALAVIFLIAITVSLLDCSECLVLFIVPMCIVHSILYGSISLLLQPLFARQIIYGIGYEVFYEEQRFQLMISTIIGLITCLIMVYDILFVYPVKHCYQICLRCEDYNF